MTVQYCEESNVNVVWCMALHFVSSGINLSSIVSSVSGVLKQLYFKTDFILF